MSTLVVSNITLPAGGLSDGSITTSDIADSAVTSAKIADGAITGPKIAAGAVSAADLDGGQSGSAPIYGARAWITFDGTTGTVLQAANASVTRDTTGQYTITFTTAMPHANYAVSGCCVGTSSLANWAGYLSERSGRSTTSLPIATNGFENSRIVRDFSIISVVVFA